MRGDLVLFNVSCPSHASLTMTREGGERKQRAVGVIREQKKREKGTSEDATEWNGSTLSPLMSPYAILILDWLPSTSCVTQVNVVWEENERKGSCCWSSGQREEERVKNEERFFVLSTPWLLCPLMSPLSVCRLVVSALHSLSTCCLLIRAANKRKRTMTGRMILNSFSALSRSLLLCSGSFLFFARRLEMQLNTKA